MTTLTVAQALTTTDTTYTIADTAAHILAKATNAAVKKASSISLLANDTGLSALSVDNATTLFKTLAVVLNGNTFTISDSYAHVYAAAATVTSGAATIKITGSVTDANLALLSSSSYASHINLTAASISGAVTVADAVYAHNQSGAYTKISDTAAHLESTTGATQADIALASTVYVTGSVTAADLDKLTADSYASKINLSNATAITGTLNVAEADYAKAHGASFANTLTISDTAADIKGGTQATIAAAHTVDMTGTLTSAQETALAAASYASKENFSGVSSVTGNLTVSQANFLLVHALPTTDKLAYGDTLANLLKAANLTSIESDLTAGGSVTATDTGFTATITTPSTNHVDLVFSALTTNVTIPNNEAKYLTSVDVSAIDHTAYAVSTTGGNETITAGTHTIELVGITTVTILHAPLS